MWTEFWDMHSGGGSKEQFDKIYIEAPETKARIVFENIFGHNPYHVSCRCCGPDYSISESETLEEATEYHRKDKQLSVEEYCQEANVFILRAETINKEDLVEV